MTDLTPCILDCNLDWGGGGAAPQPPTPAPLPPSPSSCYGTVTIITTITSATTNTTLPTTVRKDRRLKSIISYSVGSKTIKKSFKFCFNFFSLNLKITLGLRNSMQLVLPTNLRSRKSLPK